MKAKFIPFFFILALFLGSGFASAIFLGKLSCYASSQLNGSFPGSNSCNNNDADNWIASGTTNEWVVLNLTTTYDIKNISVKFGNYPFNGHVDVWNGASWIAYKNFTEAATNSNQTYQLDHVFRGNRLRVFETTTSQTNVGVLELWPQGTVVPVAPVCKFGAIGVTLDTLIPILVSAGLIVFGLGFFFIASDSKGKGKRLPMELLVVGAIGIVIAVAVAAGVVASMKVC